MDFSGQTLCTPGSMAHPLFTVVRVARLKRLLPWGIAALVFLLSFFGYLSKAPPWAVSAPEGSRTNQTLVVRNNLVQIALAADLYFQHHPDQVTVGAVDLQRWLPGGLDLTPVAGERYDSLVIQKASRTLSLTLADGTTVEWTGRPRSGRNDE